MDNLPSNSHTSKIEANEKASDIPEQKKVEKVITGKVTRRKKPLGARFAEMFFGDDTKSVMQNVMAEVLIPAAKAMIADAFNQAIERKLYGESRPPGRRHVGGPHGNSHTNYNRISAGGPPRDRRASNPPMSRRARASHDFAEIILDTRTEAQEVLDQMYVLLETYEMVTVKDLYEMVGEDYHYTDEKWGWTSLQGSLVSRVREGYVLNLPRTEQLD